MKKLYFFDFDGTLTYKDTMFLFLNFYDSKKFRLQFIKFIPLFVLLKLNLTNAEKVKKSFVSSILKGQSKSRIEKRAQDFFNSFYPDGIRQNALDFMKNMDRTKTESYLVTASLDIWVKPFAEKFQMQLIATQAEFKNGVFTGNFIGSNCNGSEKVNRIKAVIADKKYDKTLGFGDTSGDQEMLAWVNESHFKFFH
ncbi:HAD-IB family hydrolase [Chryseobacterium sp. MP_3.2]|uniref:HAD-IB family hydrolase n=1 Tax=Chryseobacterium sp. MP_3.2 TaxID=3071712 RepID=UPI002E055744|nr:phosphatidylglycerophosphatase C [Chryseobacterium sp. MP_3.2]